MEVVLALREPGARRGAAPGREGNKDHGREHDANAAHARQQAGDARARAVARSASHVRLLRRMCPTTTTEDPLCVPRKQTRAKTERNSGSYRQASRQTQENADVPSNLIKATVPPHIHPRGLPSPCSSSAHDAYIDLRRGGLGRAGSSLQGGVNGSPDVSCRVLYYMEMLLYSETQLPFFSQSVVPLRNPIRPIYPSSEESDGE